MLIGAQSALSAKPDNYRESEKIEVVSKEASDCIKAITLPQIQEHGVPTARNKRLHENLMKLAGNNEEMIKMYTDFENTFYDKCGSYVAAAILSTIVDMSVFEAFAKGDMGIFSKFNHSFWLGQRLVQESQQLSEDERKKKSPEYFEVVEECSSYPSFDTIRANELVQQLGDIHEYAGNKLLSSGKMLDEQATLDLLCEAYREMDLADELINSLKKAYNKAEANTEDEKIAKLASFSHCLYCVAIKSTSYQFFNDYEKENLSRALNVAAPSFDYDFLKNVTFVEQP